jgi:hypothetical protein
MVHTRHFIVLCPLYFVEVSPRESTGFFGTINQFGIAVGFFICSVVPATELPWNGVAAIGAIFPFIGIFRIWTVPESPADLESQEMLLNDRGYLNNDRSVDGFCGKTANGTIFFFLDMN